MGLSMTYDRKIYEADLPHRAIAVYIYLQNRANKEGFCYPAIGTIARELHLLSAQSNVQSAIWRKTAISVRNSDGVKMVAGAVCFTKS